MPSMANDALDKTRVLQRKLYRAAKRSRSRRFHALYDKVHRRDVLERAWSEVARKGGAAGVDVQTIDDVREAGVGSFLDQLQRELVEGSYRPLPVKRVAIPKAAGEGERMLGVPAVRDRVVQAAAKIVIEPIFEADFLDCSFGFRPRRSARQARERVRAHSSASAATSWLTPTFRASSTTWTGACLGARCASESQTGASSP